MVFLSCHYFFACPLHNLPHIPWLLPDSAPKNIHQVQANPIYFYLDLATLLLSVPLNRFVYRSYGSQLSEMVGGMPRIISFFG